jgi:hypothetical protein
MSNDVPMPDLRDHRGATNPGRWQEQGSPKTENTYPAGGMISPDQYRHRAPPAQNSESAPLPFNPGNGAGIRTER